MIKQDHLLRMILEMITFIANALLDKQKIRPQSWKEYNRLAQQVLESTTDSLKDMSGKAIG